jgi:hypothetical protein
MSTDEKVKLMDLNVLLIGVLAGFAVGFALRYIPLDDPALSPQPAFQTGFEENEEDFEGRWSLIPIDENADKDEGDIKGYTDGFEYKKDW